ncbi:hypothetical protein PBY51_004788 [Eleginops maclovinus]|uniref:CARMIL C-terminal domain-containing protein n=2 Tax=Eleginops maclovinus TaxID=56733 RepID=A0AAN8AC65_ELEMC|nr:hypothetical protein PBY51_004788 [Eleginops maclovinus]
MLESHTKQRPKPKKRTRPSRPARKSTGSSAPQDAEPNSIMGKLDEGLDDFFTKKVIRLSFKLPSVKGPTSSPQESADKKRESRKSGFFNLIKSRTSRSEKSTGAASNTPPHPASTTTASTSHSITPVNEETTPTSPTPHTKNPATVVDPHQELHREPSLEHTDSEMEVSLTNTEPAEERKTEEDVEKENVENNENLEKKGSPQMSRHIGFPLMGMGLMAEMKARQERMAVKKSESSSLLDKVEEDKAKSDVHPTVPAETEECKPEPIPRSKPPSVTPKPPPQVAKPLLGPRISGPLSPVSPTSPRSSSNFILDESAEAAAGNLSAKGPLPAPRLKRVPSEQERESTSSSSAGPLSPQEDEFPGDGDAFEPLSPAVDHSAGGRHWSSLKNSAVPPLLASEDDRERTKSLPAYVSPPSLADTDLSPAEEEFLSPTADLKSDSKSEDDSDDAPSV